MKILVPGLVENIQLRRLAEEAKTKGHEVVGVYASSLTLHATKKGFEAKIEGDNLYDYDLIYLMVSKRRWEWYTAALFLAEEKGTIIVNQKTIDPAYNFYLTPAIDYYRQIKNDLPMPDSAVVLSDIAAGRAARDFSFPVILKSAASRQGRGVYKIESKAQLLTKIRQLRRDSPSFVIREFIPNEGDIRVFTVGYKAIAAMKRRPMHEGEFRSNISQGGKGESLDLKANPEIVELAQKASRLMRTEIAGVDIIIHTKTQKPYILEVNPSPQFAGLEKYTSVNAARAIIKYFESLAF